MIVALNGDESVRRSKGPARPVNPEAERAEVLGALESVTAVVVFSEDTAADIIRLIRTDTLVKGADWPAEEIVGSDTVEASGAQIVLLGVAPGYSTATILERIRRTR